jgi:hypothetical protein
LTLLLVWPFAFGLLPYWVLPWTTTTSADFSLQFVLSPFQAQGEISPGKNALLHHTTARFTSSTFDHKSFAVSRPLTLIDTALYLIFVHRLVIYAPRFLSTFGHPHAVALHFAHCGQLATGLAPVGVRPCWAHKKKGLQLALQPLKIMH